MRLKAVIFDLDGTLASFNLDYKTVRALVKAYLKDKGVPEALLSINESVFEMLRKTEAWARETEKLAGFLEELRRESLAITEKHELEAAASTSLMPGVAETLKALRGMGLKVGLCTINSQKSVEHILERFGIADFFNVVVTRNQVTHVKPDPEHIEAALKTLAVSPTEAVIVGDSSVDMRAARVLGAVAVGLPTGVSTIEQLVDNGADHVVTSMFDIPPLIERIERIRAEHVNDKS